MISENEYIVTARKWRPMSFETVVGQAHITRTLENAIKNNRVHHAYLFTGPRGVGKTTTARIYAKEVIAYGIHQKDPNSNVDVNTLDTLDIIEIDGASNNSVDDIRSLRENSKYPPSLGKYKIYIIDEVHMLSTAAFNALLKTLEEPPPHLLFVFATTEPHKVPATIISRCQRFDFRRMSLDDIVSQLSMIAEKDGIKIDEQSLITIAKKADGSMRDSQSIFDQAVAFCGTDINYTDLASALNLIDEDFYFKITDNILANDQAGMFDLSSQIMSRGYDLRETLSGLMEHLRNILTIQVAGDNFEIEASQNSIDRYKEISKQFSKYDLVRMLDLIAETDKEIRFSLQPSILFELCLVQLSMMDRTESINELLAEIRQGLPEKKNFEPVEKISKPKVTSPPKTITKEEVKVEEVPLVEDIVKLEETKVEEIVETEPIQEKQEIIEEQVQETVIKDEIQPSKDIIKEEDLQEGWGAFLSKVSTIQGLKILEDTYPKFLPGKIVLMTDNSFVKNNLDRKLDILNEELVKHYGTPIESRVEHFESHQEEMQTGRDYLKEYSMDDRENDEEEDLKITMSKEEAIPYEKKSDIEKFIIDNFKAEEQLI